MTKADAQIAKNYLDADELESLNALVSGYFDIAEFRARRHIPTYMDDFVKQLDNVLSAAEAPVLGNAGTVSHKQAMRKVDEEYKLYQERTLTPVEVEYLASIKEARLLVEQAGKGDSDCSTA